MITTKPMTAADILRQVAERQIRRRKVRMISAQASTPPGAVVALLAKLDGAPQQEQLEEAYW